MISMKKVYDLLTEEIARCGSQKAFADKHEISLSYVNDVVHVRCDPGYAILKALGLKKVVMYDFDKGEEK
jgi:hypothetical protein